jgi:hypothetical protein
VAITAAPDPFRTVVRFTTTADLVVVSDAAGRAVRRIATRDGAATWDGRDAGGRVLPAGVYLYRAEGSARTGRVVKF